MRHAQNPLELHMESALSPREIQTRIRSGASIEEVAQEAGVPADQVEPFAAPVLAERQHQAGMALQSPVRRRGETGSHRTLRTVVDERLLSRGIDPDEVDWDAWRTDDRMWMVVGRYTSGSADHAPQWRFDPRARFSTAVDDEARWLIGEATPAHGPQPGRRRPLNDPDHEPTVDLNDEMALIRATQDAAEMTIPLPASIRQRSQAASGDTTPGGSAVPVDVAAQQPADRADAAIDGPASDAADRAEDRAEDQPVDLEASTSQAAVDAPAAEPGPADAALGLPDGSEGLPTATSDDAGYVDTELEQVDGVYDFVPSQQGNLDTLYEMLSGFQEDSVNIYAGLDQLPPVAASEPTPGTVSESHAEVLEVSGDEVSLTQARTVTWRAGAEGEADGGMDGTREGGDGVGEATASPVPPRQDVPEPLPADVVEDADRAREAAVAPGTGVSVEATEPTEQDPGEDVDRVATGWPATMGDEREPGTTLEEPADLHDPAGEDVRPAHVGEAASEPADVDDLRVAHPGSEAVPSESREPDSPAPQDGDSQDSDSQDSAAQAIKPESADPEDAEIVEVETTLDRGSEPKSQRETESTTEPATEPGTEPTGLFERYEPVQSSPEPEPQPERQHESQPEPKPVAGAAQKEPEQDALVEDAPPRPKPRPRNRKRASVPSWDEIMFGGPGSTSR